VFRRTAATWGIDAAGRFGRNEGWLTNVRIKGGGERGILEMRFAELTQECPAGCDHTAAVIGTAPMPDTEPTCTGTSESGEACAFVDVAPEFKPWGAVCDNRFKLNSHGAKAVCKTLGYDTFEETPESCTAVEADPPGDATTSCTLTPGRMDPAAGWQAGSCTRDAGDGRCKYTPKIPASYGHFQAIHGDDDFSVDNLECPQGSESITECTMSTPYTDTCSDVETIGIDCNKMCTSLIRQTYRQSD
jgi:hypothetical protein